MLEAIGKDDYENYQKYAESMEDFTFDNVFGKE